MPVWKVARPAGRGVWDLEEALKGVGPLGAHIGKRGVAEDEVGRHLLLARELGAQIDEALVELLVHNLGHRGGPCGGVLLCGSGLAFGHLEHERASVHLARAHEVRARRRERERRVVARRLGKKPTVDELVDDGADVGHGNV